MMMMTTMNILSDVRPLSQKTRRRTGHSTIVIALVTVIGSRPGSWTSTVSE